MINVIIGLFIGLFIGILIMSLMKISTINDLQEEIAIMKANNLDKDPISFLSGIYQERNFWKSKLKKEIDKLENEKHLYFEKQIIQGKIDLLKEFMKEDK